MSDPLLELWRREEAEPFRGWDFSHLRGRWKEEHPPWSYEELARALLRSAKAAADLGTGGGERLARLVDAFPERMFATEAYPPNVVLARERLEPLGVTVIPYRSEDVLGGPLPFADASLDLVLDRHESYDAREVARVLVPGGQFLTQQVDGASHAELFELFYPGRVTRPVKLKRFVADAERAGLRVLHAEEWWGDSTFADVAALVYYLKAIVWDAPGFSVMKFERVLRELHSRSEREHGVRSRIGQFLLLARRP